MTSPPRYMRPASYQPNLGLVTLIVSHVAQFYGVEAGDITKRCRQQRLSWIRHVAMWCSMKLLSISTVECGAAFGRNHGTVLHALQRVNNARDVYPELKSEIDRLMEAAGPLLKAAERS